MPDFPQDPPPYPASEAVEVTGRSPSTGLVVIGVLNIMWGTLGLFCCGMLGIFGMAAAVTGAAPPQFDWTIVDFLVPVSHFCFSLLLIVAGGGIMKLCTWARGLTVVACSGILITVAVNILFGGWRTGTGFSTEEAVGAFCGALAAVSYPAFAVVYMSRGAVRAMFEPPPTELLSR